MNSRKIPQIPKDQIKNLQFADVIYHLTDKNVLKFETSVEDKWVAEIYEIAKQFVIDNQKITLKKRNNEIGLDVQKRFKDCLLKTDNLIVENSKGGYPDYIIKIKGYPSLYLECKSFEKGAEKDTLRSFYISPSVKKSILEDGYHLVIAFEFDKINNNKYYRLIKCIIVDCFDLIDIKLKYEFNACNRDLYSLEKKYEYNIVSPIE